MELKELRQKHSRLIYNGFDFDKDQNDLILTFKLTLEPDLHFKPQLRIKNLDSAILEQIDIKENLDSQLDKLFFHLGLAEIPSYFKAACPAEILIRHNGQINAEAVPFWHDLLIRGLGEFYYHNQIDFTAANFLTIKLEETTSSTDTSLVKEAKQTFQAPGQNSQALIPVGGGKDSSTVLGMMEERQLPYDIFLLAPHAAAAKKIAELLQKDGSCQKIIEAERRIDPLLLELNKKGYLNGHTPFSAYLAFVSSAVAYLHGHANILLGNEASSEEENLLYLGHKINHQYSKSLDFEQKFAKYSQTHLFAQIGQKDNMPPQYLSLLRSFSELEITEKFCALAKKDPKFAQILTTFKSCNVGQKNDRWCHDCPKCAFVFTMLAAFLDQEFISQQIFAENLFAKKSLRQTFFDLAGFGDKKPFECVGTFAEVRQALLMAYQRSNSPSPLLTELKRKIASTQLMDKLANKSILILGMGREGISTLQFLRQHFPEKKIAVADEKFKQLAADNNLITHFGENYLDQVANYQIIIKTAGIPITTPAIQTAMQNGSEVLSNTQIFFTLCQGKIIGITGTKGKSTTSQLSYEILKQAYPKTILLGNIGEAPLNLLNEIDPETLVVDELSCHQLAELEDSPEVAVVLDIKPEHLDYYKDFASYFAAKSAIARHQKSSDYLIYNPELEGSSKMAALSPAIKLTHTLQENSNALVYQKNGQIFYQNELIMASAEVPLIGEHNLYNVMPAIILGKLFGISNELIREAIKNFHNLAHRLELVATLAGVKYFDDSIAVNPHATMMAIKSFPKKSVILIAGGYERNQDFTELAQVMAEFEVKSLIALPSTGERLVEFALRERTLTTALVENMEEAVTLAHQQAKSGDVVLMSPASASYNSFNSYEERGQAFLKAILQLQPNQKSNPAESAT